MPNLTITDHHFGFVPSTSHRPTCRYAGTSMWEVSRHHHLRNRAEADGGEYIETTIRMLCRSCGVVQLDQAEGGWGTTNTSTSQIGYGSKPERCAGLWLHPGPRRAGLSDADQELGPETYFVTGSPNPPASISDVIGMVGWVRPWLGTRHGTVRWWAGHGMTERGVKDGTEPKYKSRTAAARWVADRHGAAAKASAAKS